MMCRHGEDTLPRFEDVFAALLETFRDVFYEVSGNNLVIRAYSILKYI